MTGSEFGTGSGTMGGLFSGIRHRKCDLCGSYLAADLYYSAGATMCRICFSKFSGEVAEYERRPDEAKSKTVVGICGQDVPEDHPAAQVAFAGIIKSLKAEPVTQAEKTPETAPKKTYPWWIWAFAYPIGALIAVVRFVKSKL